MQLASVRELKAVLAESVLAAGGPTRTAAFPAMPLEHAARPLPQIAMGVVQRGPDDYKLAVRYQRRDLEASRVLDTIRRQAHNEVDVRFIGRVTRAAAVPWSQRRHRPLKIGTSIGHHLITAGTLGAVVSRRTDRSPLLLSNNHVLANENRARLGDAILQPGKLDAGADPVDVAATLAGMVKLKKTTANAVDCAVAAPAGGTEFDPRGILGLGRLAGLGTEFVDEGTEVAKLGRTTGLTRGTVTAFEVDGVVVEYGLGPLRFDGQFEVQGVGEAPFARGGDSGSLIVDADRRAIGLLFACSEVGGTNSQGLTYANPIRAVLDALAVDLVM
jgi:hypothetical protein